MWHSRSYPEFPKHTSCGLPYKKDASKSTLSFESMYPPSELRVSRFIGNGPLTPKGCGGHEKPWGPHPERCPNTGQLIDLSSPAAFGRVKLIQACRYPGRITHKLYTTSNPLQHVFFVKWDFWFFMWNQAPQTNQPKKTFTTHHHTTLGTTLPVYSLFPPSLEVLEASFTRSLEVTSSPKVPVLFDRWGGCEDDSG